MDRLGTEALPDAALRFLLHHLPGRLSQLLHGRRRGDARARRLLLAHLTPAQREALVERGYFVVRGNRTGDEYQIWAGTTFNVVRVRDGVRFCFQPHLPHARLPLADIVLGQALLLRHDEDRVLRMTVGYSRTRPTRSTPAT